MLIKSFGSYGKYNQREIYDLKEMRLFLFAVKLIMAIRVCDLRMETISVLIMASRIRKFLKTLSKVKIFFIRNEYLYVWTVVSRNLRIRLHHSLGSSLHYGGPSTP